MNKLMEEVIGEVQVELDGRFSSMRTKETNLGEFPVDAFTFWWNYTLIPPSNTHF